jgi:general secretion pathway protein F
MAQIDGIQRPTGPIGIEHLISLNDEIAALVRCGFPLERGLLDAGRDLPGRLGRITSVLGSRMSRGESLGQALASEERAIPPLYRAVIEAGLRTGRLPAALEGLAGYARGYAEARRAIGLAFIYPLTVAVFAYLLFLGFVTLVLPRFIAALDSLGLAVIAPVRWLEVVGNLAPIWWPVGPVVLVVLALFWTRSGRAMQFEGKAWSLVRLVPWSKSLLADYEAANFTALLALLIEHGVSLPEALVLAGGASGNARLNRETGELSESLKRGDSMKSALDRDKLALPPLVRWVLAAGQSQGSLTEALRNLAATYRKRANHRAEKLQIFLPIVLMFVFGVGATLLYGLALFIPLVNLLDGLSLR